MCLSVDGRLFCDACFSDLPMSVEREITGYLADVLPKTDLSGTRSCLILMVFASIESAGDTDLNQAYLFFERECLRREIVLKPEIDSTLRLTMLLGFISKEDRVTFVNEASILLQMDENDFPDSFKKFSRHWRKVAFQKQVASRLVCRKVPAKRPRLRNQSGSEPSLAAIGTPSTTGISSGSFFHDSDSPQTPPERSTRETMTLFAKTFGSTGSAQREMVDTVIAIIALVNGPDDDVLRSDSPAIVMHLISETFEESGMPYARVPNSNSYSTHYRILQRDLALKCFRREIERTNSSVFEQLHSTLHQVLADHEGDWIPLADIPLGETLTSFGPSETLECFKSLCQDAKITRCWNRNIGLDRSKLCSYLASQRPHGNIPQLGLNYRLPVLRDVARPFMDLVGRALEKVLTNDRIVRHNQKLPLIADEIFQLIRSLDRAAAPLSATDVEGAATAKAMDEGAMDEGVVPAEAISASLELTIGQASDETDSEKNSSNPGVPRSEILSGERYNYFKPGSNSRITRTADYRDIITAGLQTIEVKRIPVSQIQSEEDFDKLTNGASCPVVLISEVEEPTRSVLKKQSLESRLLAENPMRYKLHTPINGKLDTSGTKAATGKLDDADWALLGNATHKRQPSPLDSGGQLTELLPNENRLVSHFSRFLDRKSGNAELVENQLFISKTTRPYTINIHIDEYANLYRCLSGTKKWTIFLPVLASMVFPGDNVYRDPIEDISASKWNGRDDPQGYARYEIILSPGEWLYVPPRCPHQVESSHAADELSVAINFIYPFKNEIPVTRSGALEYVITDEQLRLWKGLHKDRLAEAIFDYIKAKHVMNRDVCCDQTS